MAIDTSILYFVTIIIVLGILQKKIANTFEKSIFYLYQYLILYTFCYNRHEEKYYV